MPKKLIASGPRGAARARVTVATLALLLTLVGARRASAYTIQTQITQGCHESITEDALRKVRSASKLAPALPSTEPDDDAIVGDVPFTTPDDFMDIGSTTLIIGVRDNDVKDLSATALDELAQLTADSAGQREHCLRAGGEKEPNGTSQAVADCRAFIKEKLLAALGGLGPNGAPDGSLRDALTTQFALRGKLTVSLPRFYLNAGQALHAIQDSFTHTFRKASDQHRITVTLDWIDYADNALDEGTEGPPHMSQLDRCDDPDDLRTQKHRLAVEASARALQIALDTTLSRDAKSAAFDQMLDAYIVYDGSGGCTYANAWCNAAENQYRPSGCACGMAGARLPGGTGIALGAFVVCAFVGRRRRWDRRLRQTRGARQAVAVGVASMFVMAATQVASADDRPATPAEPHGLAGPAAALEGKSNSGAVGKTDTAGAFFGHAAVGASYDHAALAFAVGAKYQIFKYWMVGLDAEWNPWLPVQPFGIRPGTANLYASVVRRYQMVWESVNFRTTAALGVSTLLVDLPGAPKGGIGPLFGISFIGVEFKLSPGFFLVIDPTYLVFDAPHLTGTPLVYYQYRFQVAIEFGG